MKTLIWYFILHQVIFHLSFKKQSYHFRKVQPDDKGRNWLILSYSACERPSSWERLRRDFFGLLPTESLIASTLLGHLAVNFLSDLGFSAFMLWLFTDIVYPTINLAFHGIVVKLNFQQNFACTVLDDFVFKLVVTIFFPSCPRHCDREVIVVIVYYFLIWNQKNTTLL